MGKTPKLVVYTAEELGILLMHSQWECELEQPFWRAGYRRIRIANGVSELMFFESYLQACRHMCTKIYLHEYLLQKMFTIVINCTLQTKNT